MLACLLPNYCPIHAKYLKNDVPCSKVSGHSGVVDQDVYSVLRILHTCGKLFDALKKNSKKNVVKHFSQICLPLFSTFDEIALVTLDLHPLHCQTSAVVTIFSNKTIYYLFISYHQQQYEKELKININYKKSEIE